MQQRTDSVGCACLLRDGPRQIVLPPDGKPESPQRSRRRADRAVDLDQPVVSHRHLRATAQLRHFAALVFYALTTIGLFRPRSSRPGAERPYKVVGFPVLPALYIHLPSAIAVVLL